MEDTNMTAYFSNEHLILVEKNQPIHNNTDPWNHIFFLQQGIAIVKRIHADGTEELLRFAKENSFVGFPNYITVTTQLAENDTSIYACTDCILYKIPNDEFKTLSYQHPDILEFLIIQMSMGTRTFRKQMDFISHKQTINAVASLLINLQVKTSSGDFLIPSCISNYDIATYLKVHFVTTSKIIHTLIQNQILEKREKQLYIIDYPKLFALANSEMLE